MNQRTTHRMRTLSGLLFAAAVIGAGHGDSPAGYGSRISSARGTFDVRMTPQPSDSGGGSFQRLYIAKQYHGDLVASGSGQMLASGNPGGSGGYVAFERVSGELHGKRGSFVLQHWGTMRGGVFTIRVTVVPDSGTDGLTGISGTMTIVIEGSRHEYEFEYSLTG